MLRQEGHGRAHASALGADPSGQAVLIFGTSLSNKTKRLESQDTIPSSVSSEFARLGGTEISLTGTSVPTVVMPTKTRKIRHMTRFECKFVNARIGYFKQTKKPADFAEYL